MDRCTRCDAPLASALACEVCGALQTPPLPVDPWAALGLEVGYDVDPAHLKKRLLALQRRMHPDFFAGAAEDERASAERNTAELNAAYAALSDDARRADLLVRRLGGPDDQAERQMPAAFLAEVLEWNETLELARSAPPGAPERDALGPLEAELSLQRAAALARLRGLLSPRPEPGAPSLLEARRVLNAVRYLDRTLHALSELKLESARSAR